MRSSRGWRWLAVVAVVLAGLGTGVLISAAGPREDRPAIVRHVDPEAIAEDTEPVALFPWYLDAVELLRARRFRETRALLAYVDLAHLPPDIRSLAREVSWLEITVSGLSESALGSLRDALALLAEGKTAEAQARLAEAERIARRTGILLDDLVEGFTDLGRRTQVEALPPDHPARQAYEALLQAIPELRALLTAFVSTVVATRAAAAGETAAAAPAQVLTAEGIPAVAAAQALAAIALPTRLALTAESPVYPGRAFQVSIAVVEEGPVLSEGRRLTLRLNDRPLLDLPLEPAQLTVVLPPDVKVGTHLLIAETPPAGPYLGATASTPLDVIQAPAILQVERRRTVQAPGRLLLQGSAASMFGPLAGAAVEARLGPALARTMTSADGTFTLTLRLPAAFDLVGPETVEIRVLPQEPWNAPGLTTIRTFVVNLVHGALIALAVVILPAIGLARRRRRRHRIAAVIPLPSFPPLETARSPLPSSPRLETAPSPPAAPALLPADVSAPAVVQTPRDEVITLYVEAARWVQGATGITVAPGVTMREFASAVRARLPSAAFTELTAVAEVAVYASRPITQEQVTLARQLSAEFHKEAAYADLQREAAYAAG